MKHILFIIFTFLLLTTTSYAATEDLINDNDEYDDFDSIVKNLSNSTSQIDSPLGLDPFDSVKLHFSVGVVNNYLKISSHQSLASGFQQGMQASLGIDLFSPHWMAEGTVRSFSETDIEKTSVSMHEFDLKIAYRIYPQRTLNPYLGFGVAASYLVVKDSNLSTVPSTPTRSTKYSTPNSIVFAGTSYRFTEGIGMGIEFSYRSPMIEETIQKASLDMTLRLNTTF